MFSSCGEWRVFKKKKSKINPKKYTTWWSFIPRRAIFCRRYIPFHKHFCFNVNTTCLYGKDIVCLCVFKNELIKAGEKKKLSILLLKIFHLWCFSNIHIFGVSESRKKIGICKKIERYENNLFKRLSSIVHYEFMTISLWKIKYQVSWLRFSLCPPF